MNYTYIKLKLFKNIIYVFGWEPISNSQKKKKKEVSKIVKILNSKKKKKVFIYTINANTSKRYL